MDLDMESDEENEEDLVRPLVHHPVVFDAGPDQTPGWEQERGVFTEMPRAVQGIRDRDAEDVWAELG